MKTYQVRVNGKMYTVEIEAVQEETSPAPAYRESVPEASPAVPAVPAAQAEQADAAPVGEADARNITSPMPGTVVQIAVQAGDAVRAGALLLVLEAMKMENEIMAPRDGVISQVAVSVGDSVNAGDLLIRL